MQLSFNLHSIILIIATVITFALTWYTWKRRYLKGGYYLSLMLFANLLWIFFVTFEVASQSIEWTIIFSKATYLGIVFVGPFFLLFVVDYLSKSKDLIQKWWTKLIFVIPLISLVAVFTNELHFLFWEKIFVIQTNPYLILQNSYGWIFYLNTFFSYICLAIGGSLLSKSLFKSSGAEKKRIGLLILALLMPFFANIITLLKFEGIEGIDLTPLAFVISVVMIASAIFRFSLFQSAPSIRTQIIASLEDAVIIIGKDLKILDLNQKAKDQFGGIFSISNNAELVFNKWPQILSAIVKNNDTTVEIETQENLEKGRKREYYDVSISNLKNENNTNEAKLLVFKNITSKKKAEIGLQATEQKLAEIFNSLPDGSFVVDLEGRVIIWNEAMTTITGILPEQVINKAESELAHLVYGVRRPLLVHAALTDREDILKFYEEVSVEKDSYSGIVRFAELNKRQNVVLWISAKKLYNQNGESIGAIETVRDVSKSRLVDQEFSTTKSALSAIVENTKDIIIYIDKDWKVITFNSAFKDAVYALLQKEVKAGEDFHNYIFPGKENWWESNFKEALNGSQFVTELEYLIEGKRLNYEVAFNPVKVEGQVIGVSTFIRDITERKSSDDLLKEKMAELARANEIMIGRELKMIELKEKLMNADGTNSVE